MPSILVGVGSAIDRATLRVLGRAFNTRGGRREAPTHDPVVLLEHGRAFYDSAETRTRYFAEPQVPRVRETARERLMAGAVVDLSWESGYEPLFEPIADEYVGYTENRIMHARHLRHDRPAPTIICLHGWGGGAYWIEERAFAARWFYRCGFDVVLATLPFHGLRTPKQVRLSGALFPTANVFRTNEAFAHSVHDLRALVGWLRSRGAPRVGFMGMSLGGYTTALVSSVDSSIDFAIPMIPAVSFADLLWDHGKGTRGRKRAETAGVTKQMLVDFFRVHCPLEHQPKVPHERRFIIAGLGDRITPPSQAKALWRHWGEPKIHWFAGAHLLQIGRGEALREVRRFLSDK
jgi:dienelactone hydrolase